MAFLHQVGGLHDRRHPFRRCGFRSYLLVKSWDVAHSPCAIYADRVIMVIEIDRKTSLGSKFLFALSILWSLIQCQQLQVCDIAIQTTMNGRYALLLVMKMLMIKCKTSYRQVVTSPDRLASDNLINGPGERSAWWVIRMPKHVRRGDTNAISNQHMMMGRPDVRHVQLGLVELQSR